MAKQDDFGGFGIALVAFAAYLIINKKASASTTQPSAAAVSLANTLPTASGNVASDPYIAWVQTSLNQILGAGLKIDGQIGPQTRAWIIKFQQAWSLPATGVIDPETDYSIRSALGQPGYTEQPYNPDSALAIAGEY
jgi:peptidoglycan hydrolase-like protein with peptidoglycan-binding domain